MPYVYVLETTCKTIIKVGYSATPIKRARNINGNSALPVELVWQKEFETEAIARAEEELAQDKLTRRGFHFHGDWFTCSAAEAVNEIEGYPDGHYDGPWSKWPRELRLRGVMPIENLPELDALISNDLKYFCAKSKIVLDK